VIGACSCEVKRQHPGVDLLTSTDWDAALKGGAAPEPEPVPVPVAGESVPIPRAPRPAVAAETNPPPANPEPPEAGLPRALLLAAAAAAVLLVLVTGAWALRSGRARRGHDAT
jgi:hypothetical protein